MGVMPRWRNNKAINIPPAKTLPIVRQLAMPVQSRIMAPMAMAITLVSPTLPGIKPVIMSLKL